MPEQNCQYQNFSFFMFIFYFYFFHFVQLNSQAFHLPDSVLASGSSLLLLLMLAAVQNHSAGSNCGWYPIL